MQFTLKPKLTITRYFSFAKVLLVNFMMILSVKAESHELARCGRALHLATQGIFIETIRPEFCPISSRLVQWLQLQNPLERTNMSFSKVTTFLRNNPNWPLRDRLQSQAEEALKDTDNRSELRKWFDENPPLTAKGATFYARALMKTGKQNAAKKVVRNAWINFDFDAPSLKSFWKEFKEHLSQEDHYRRVDRLLMREKTDAARVMFPWLNKNHKTSG